MVEEFIQRRFKENCHWLDGNCYYMALILKDRFPQGKILYDVINGHFVTEIDGIKYDWGGMVNNPSAKYVEWNSFHEYDSLQQLRIIRDCLA